MNQSLLLLVRVIVGWSIFSASASIAQDLLCPPMPDNVTQVNRDVRSDITANVGTLGKLKAGEIGVKTEVVAKNLFDKYPNTDRILIAEMMAATYCSLLRNSKTMSESEKLNLWQQFSERVFKFDNPHYGVAPHQTLKPGIQQRPPSGPSDKSTTRDSIAVEVGRAKPTIEF